jgi:hypothetical protein
VTAKSICMAAAVLAVALAATAAIPAVEEAPAKRTVHFTPPERITGFHSDIAVRDDASLAVTDTIEVVALGREIRHGIYRDFLGEGGKRGFEVVEALRDGEAEPFHIVDLKSYTRVYLGKADVLLDPGEYTYTLAYTTTQGLSSSESEEELSWDVNGTGWQFPMERVSATVTLPAEISPEDVSREGYTGRRGERGRDYRCWTDEEGKIRFETTRPLLPGEFLTILLRWPKARARPAGAEIESAPGAAE